MKNLKQQLLLLILTIGTTAQAQVDSLYNEITVYAADSIIYSVPTSMSALSTGDLIKNYCIKEFETVEGFTAMVNKQLSDTIYADLIWEIIKEEKEPIGELRVVIYRIVMPKPTLWIDEKGNIHRTKTNKPR